MKEDFLHYVWKTKRFDWRALRSTTGVEIEIIDFGHHNFHAGPDFSAGKVKIDRTIWAGNIEIHLRSSHWYQHRHQEDPNYNNVILHVVYVDDKPVRDSVGNRIPTIELKNRIDLKLIDQYEQLMAQESWIPCENNIHQVDSIISDAWKDRLMVERLQTKTAGIENLLKLTTGNWEEAFYRALSKAFGLKVNATPFELLAGSIDLKTLLKYKDQSLHIEALLFGQSGFLDQEFEDAYPQKLKSLFQVLRKKHSLVPIEKRTWKFMRLRPANFPTIRIAQMAQLIIQSNHLFSKMLAASSIREIENMFDVKLSNYWKTHYRFDISSKSRPKRLGKSSIQLLIINTIVPFLFFYGRYRKEERYIERSLEFVRQCKPESNAITNRWKALNIAIENAGDSQALLQLKTAYCSQKKCMSCAIGAAILK